MCALAGIQTADTFVRIDVDKFPIRIGVDQVCVILRLRCKAGELLVAVRGNTSVTCHPSFGTDHLGQPCLRVDGCRDHGYFRHGVSPFRARVLCLAASFISSVQLSERDRSCHNLRHLFARTFYGIEKDIAKLADILGHSSINTTRIYIISTGAEHRQRLENMRLVI